MALIDWLFGTARFVPHGFCLLWRPDLVAIHVVSDAMIALAYFAIPWAIWWFAKRRTDLEPEHRRMALLFVVFIVLCGLTHVIAIATLWTPVYGLQALLKGATALVSLVTALALPFLAPKLLKIPSARALQSTNEQLLAEVTAHRQTLGFLEEARGRLERTVADRDEDLRAVNARFLDALTGSPVTLLEQDDSLRYTWVFNSPYAGEPHTIMGKTEFDFLAPGIAESVQAVKREALQSGEIVRREVQMSEDGEHWIDLRVQPAALRDGRRGLLAVGTDISALKRHQRHLQLVMTELNHRSKNLLHIVQSLARQTAAGFDVPSAFTTRLGERLKSLAAAHDVLVRDDWRGADLEAVVETQLRHQIDPAGQRIRIEGPKVDLAPEMAHYVGLAIHELGSNAAKYGGLSVADGRVEVTWRREGGELELTWRESGGPPATAPHRRGFGRTILEELAPRALGGRATLTLDGEVVWTLTVPLKAV